MPASPRRPLRRLSRLALGFGAYQLERQVGLGGMGEVWLARRIDGRFEGAVALKVLHAHVAQSAARERFVREGKILGQLSHPHIARLLDAGATPLGILYFVLEYVEGKPVDQWCDEQSLDVPARLRLFLQVCDAVAHAHAHLVIHRDLKPPNILVTAQGEIKLLDFGIAKLVESEKPAEETELTRLSGRALTPDFAAPEQILGQPVTTATDVYSLGILLYVLLSGRRPYSRQHMTGRELERDVQVAEALPLGRATLTGEDADTIAGQRSSTPRNSSVCCRETWTPSSRRHCARNRSAATRQSSSYRQTWGVTWQGSRCSPSATPGRIALRNSSRGTPSVWV